MMTLLGSLLSALIPILLKTLSDRMETPQNKEKPNAIKELHRAKDSIGVAVAWKRHDNRLERLLLKAKTRNRP